MRRRCAPLLAAAAAFTLSACLVADAAGQQQYDVLIRGGRVLDGSGNPWFAADIGVRDDRIVAVGRLDGATAARVIDATGRHVAPGFIDIHSHADDTGNPRNTLRSDDPRRRAAPNLVTQGITTVVVNQDGRSAWPIAAQRAAIDSLGIGPNAVLLVGHGTVRGRVMGSDVQRPATAAEVDAMRALVRQAVAEGAAGMSAGLEYAPGRWSTTDEVVALVDELRPFGGFYISHERSEGSDPMWFWPSQDEPGPPTLLDAVRETIEIGERTGVTVVASHIKAKGAHYWGSGAAAIQLIEAARARGVPVFADQYPYETSGTDGNTVLIPGWALGAGVVGGPAVASEPGPVDYAARLRAVLQDTALNADLRRDIAHEISRRGGADKVLVFDYPDQRYVGRSLAWVATELGMSPVDAAIRLQLDGFADRRGGARVRGFSLSMLDLDMYAARPWVATATDGGIAMPGDAPTTHARFYGTFPRRIRHFALDRGVITLEDAIRSSTSLPATIIGLMDRGVLRAGAFADIVIFDADRIRDTSTFTDPHQYAEGVDYVFVNGRLVVDRGELVWALPGRILSNRDQ
jgi:N-acyl-D-amino-acid deacylase